jgi:aconitate hydratase
MGILPLQFKDGESAETLGLTGDETFTINYGELAVGKLVDVVASNGKTF